MTKQDYEKKLKELPPEKAALLKDLHEGGYISLEGEPRFSGVRIWPSPGFPETTADPAAPNDMLGMLGKDFKWPDPVPGSRYQVIEDTMSLMLQQMLLQTSAMVAIAKELAIIAEGPACNKMASAVEPINELHKTLKSSGLWPFVKPEQEQKEEQ